MKTRFVVFHFKGSVDNNNVCSIIRLLKNNKSSLERFYADRNMFKKIKINLTVITASCTYRDLNVNGFDVSLCETPVSSL